MTAVTPDSAATDAGTDTREAVHEAARRARVASRRLALLTTTEKDAALHAAADALLAAADTVLAANAEDIEAAAPVAPRRPSSTGCAAPPRIDGIARRPAPGGRTARPDRRRGPRLDAAERSRAAPGARPARRGRHGLRSTAQRHGRRLRSRPEVRQRRAAARLVVRGPLERRARRGAACLARESGIPADAVQLLPSADRSSVTHLIQARGLVDVVIPRVAPV